MKKTVLILHGWSTTMSGKRYHVLADLLKQKGFIVFSPDLPGFGNTKLKKNPMTLDDYVAYVVDFMKRKEMKDVILIGHSFGGRIAAKLAYKYPKKIAKLILTGAPLIREKLSLKKEVASTAASFGKKTLGLLPRPIQGIFRKGLYFAIGEWDYYNAGELKETLQAIINEDTAPILGHITTPTLVVWGAKDTFVPPYIGQAIAQHIPNAKYVSVANATHKLPYESPENFINAITPFLV